MDVLVFLGSPRKKGNTEVLTQAVLEGVTQAGGTPEIIRLNDLQIAPCISCGGCDKTGKCVVEDDMIPLYKKIIATDRIIIASPIYFYGVTAQAKAFIDRTQALWNRKRLFEGAILTVKYAYDAMDMAYGGEFLVTGPDKRGDMAKYEEKLIKARAAGENFIRGLDAHVD
jgi:multimeric flavodoxin WrbA